jgi:hypothetical protein
MAKTSPTMRAALAAMREAGGLEYRTGGWWVRKGTPYSPTYAEYWTRHTINALHTRGLIRTDLNFTKAEAA